MKEVKLTCICCPMGCELTAVLEKGVVVSVCGNSCPRGANYAQKEVTNPTRIVTTTVKVKGAKEHILSVKTASDIPRGKIFECLAALKNVEAVAPVKIGDVILQNAANSGIDIVATKNIEKA